jgi:hypothetical protein
MAHLNKEGIILKLASYGVSDWQGVSRLKREQGLPTRYITPRKPFWDETEVDAWLGRRSEAVVKSNTTHRKLIKAQRKSRKAKNTTQKSGHTTVIKAFNEAEQKADSAQSVDAKSFKKAEA